MEEARNRENKLVAQSITISIFITKNPHYYNYKNQATVFYGGNLC